MKAHHYSKSRRFTLLAGLLSSLLATAPAATVSINSNGAAVAAGDLVASARIRASNTSWDMALSNGDNFLRNNAARSGLANRFVARGNTYSFNLEYRAGEGYIFTVMDNRTDRVTTQAWGRFTSPPATRNIVATLGGESPLTPFNALQIEARATIAGARTTFSDLAFTSADLGTSGGNFYRGALERNTVIGTNAAGTAVQDLLSDVDLASYSWTLRGMLNLSRNAGRNNADAVSLSINMLQVAGQATVPEPTGAALLVCTLGAAFLRRRR